MLLLFLHKKLSNIIVNQQKDWQNYDKAWQYGPFVKKTKLINVTMNAMKMI